MKNYDNNMEDFLNEDSEKAGWITTFADLMTLLLVFFVLLFSISSFNLKSYKTTVNEIRATIGEGALSIGLTDLLKVTDILDTRRTIERLTGLKIPGKTIYDDVNQFIDSKNLTGDVGLEYFEGKLIIRVKGEVLFQSGSADITGKGKPILKEIADIIEEYSEYNVNIQGHTDDIPIKTARFPSNWDLSAIRATNVLKFLINKGVSPKRLTATGYGDYFPIRPNTSKANRAMNRRVEFVLEKKAP